MNKMNPDRKNIIKKTARIIADSYQIGPDTVDKLNQLFKIQSVTINVSTWYDYLYNVLIPEGMAFVTDWKWNPVDFFDALNRFLGSEDFVLQESNYIEDNQDDTKARIRYLLDIEQHQFFTNNYIDDIETWVSELNAVMNNKDIFIVHSNSDNDDTYIFAIVKYEVAPKLVEILDNNQAEVSSKKIKYYINYCLVIKNAKFLHINIK